MGKTTLRNTLLVLIVLLVIFAGVNFYLSNSSTCIVGNTTSCSDVQNSQYGKILGIKVSLIGLIAFIFLLLVYIGSIKEGKYKNNFYEIYLISVIIGFLAAIYFISLQIFIIKATCINCMIIDSIMLLVALLTFLDYRKQKRR